MIDIIDRLRAALLLVAAVFVLAPGVELVASVVLHGLQTAQGRYEAIVTLSNSLLFMLIGAALAAVVTAVTGSRLSVRILGALNVLAGVAVLLAAADLLREARPLGIASPLESVDAYEVGAWKAAFKLLSGALVFGVLAGTLFRHERSLARAEDDGVAFLLQRKA